MILKVFAVHQNDVFLENDVLQIQMASFVRAIGPREDNASTSTASGSGASQATDQLLQPEHREEQNAGTDKDEKDEGRCGLCAVEDI